MELRPEHPSSDQHADSDRLFRVYVAGFLASGEGFNGEWPYDDGRKDPSPDLREGFDYWLAHSPEPWGDHWKCSTCGEVYISEAMARACEHSDGQDVPVSDTGTMEP